MKSHRSFFFLTAILAISVQNLVFAQTRTSTIIRSEPAQLTLTFDSKNFRDAQINQPYAVTIPSTQYIIQSTTTEKSCVKLQKCDSNSINTRDNITWSGFYYDDRIDRHKSMPELAKSLSDSVKGITLEVAEIILTSKAVEASRSLEIRPLNWDGFKSAMHSIEIALASEGISLRLAIETTEVNGVYNSKFLGYYISSRTTSVSCREKQYLCQSDQYEVKKNILHSVTKTIIVNYQPTPSDRETYLFFHEEDKFIFTIDPTDNGSIKYEAFTPYNEYKVSLSTTPMRLNEWQFQVQGLKRNIVELPKDFVGVLPIEINKRLHFMWTMEKKYLVDLALNEQENIQFSYSLCQRWILGCRPILSETFFLSDPRKGFNTENSNFFTITLLEHMLKKRKNYILRYKINMVNSSRVKTPSMNSFKVKFRYDGN